MDWRPLQIVERVLEGQPRDTRPEGSRLAGDNPIDDKVQSRPQDSELLEAAGSQNVEAPLGLTVRAPRAVALGPEPHSFQPDTPQMDGALGVEVGVVPVQGRVLPEGLQMGIHSEKPNRPTAW